MQTSMATAYCRGLKVDGRRAMKRRGVIIRMLMLVGLAAAVTASGCAEIPVANIPDFWQEGEIEVVAVAPFRNMSDDYAAGAVVADRFAGALAINGTYPVVYSRADLDVLAAEDRLRRPIRPGYYGDVVKHQADAQAIIVGTVTEFGTNTVTELRREIICHGQGADRYDRGGRGVRGRRDRDDRRGRDRNDRRSRDHDYARNHDGRRQKRGCRCARRHVGPIYREYLFTHNEAEVGVTASMLWAETGEIMHATTTPVRSRAVSGGSPPPMGVDGCLDAAVDAAVRELVVEFAITHSTVTVDAGKVLRITAGEYRGRQWRDKGSFTTADEKMAVVINLPPEAHRNRFDLTIRHRDAAENAVVETFIWRRDGPPEGAVFEFDPSQLAAVDGPGEYELAFHAAGRPVMTRAFWIREAK
ncbi:MAG: hypothetical protein ACYS8X_04950 [Planctomycetota bacterium]|jgi:hypothetical protein